MISLLHYFRLNLMWPALLLAFSFPVTAHHGHDISPDARSLPWTLSLSENTLSLAATPGKVNVIIFRLDNDKENFKDLPVNIFANGKYHASLLPESRAAILTLCPGTNQLAVISGQHGRQPVLPENISLTSLKMQSDTVLLYLVTVDAQGKAGGEWVSGEQYENAVRQLPRQAHTLSRFMPNNRCEAEIFTLNGSALFDFNTSDVSGLRPEGRRAIEEVISSINRDYASVERIIVKGYTDPVGFPDYNRKLSELRAKTVADIFKQAHIGSADISYYGMGAGDPLVKDCSVRYENIAVINACNQPNRRVEVNVFGTKKTLSRQNSPKIN